MKILAERMVGDIDFLFSKDDYPKAITVLREFGYLTTKYKYSTFPYRHYPRLIKKIILAGVEIHKNF